MDVSTHDDAARLEDLRKNIAMYAKDYGRKPADIDLVAVSKTYSAAEIRPFLVAGQRVFGENRVQEAYEKWPQLRAEFPDVSLHLIGSLQSNKAREALALFDVIESLDRPSLAKALAEALKKQGDEKTGKIPQLYIQVNTGSEAQKGGVLPDEADAFIQTCRETYGLTIVGLMCIPPHDQPPSPHFALLAKIAKRNGLQKLSMGMSADYPYAIQMGATSIRVGSALFGARQ